MSVSALPWAGDCEEVLGRTPIMAAEELADDPRFS